VDAVRRIEGTVRVLAEFASARETVREPCNVWELVDRALRIVQNDLVHRARIVTQLGPAPVVLADRARLVEVLVHLLQSAAASIPASRWDTSRVTVSLSTDDEGNAAVRVTDDGDPVPEEALPRLFDPYATRGARADGAAFRLSICHRIVTSIGGRIGVESSGAGTSVTVTLPRLPA
jgi:signal transduction histidine kinase